VSPTTLAVPSSIISSKLIGVVPYMITLSATPSVFSPNRTTSFFAASRNPGISVL
jgi:hypothetical protein